MLTISFIYAAALLLRMFPGQFPYCFLISRNPEKKICIPDAFQIRQSLIQASSSYTGHWHRGVGYGVLDVSNLLSNLSE